MHTHYAACPPAQPPARPPAAPALQPPAPQESRRNQLKDFVHVAGPLGVTHFLILTATHNASYLRVAKPPRGPTLTLRIHEYSLIRDVVAAQQRPRMPQVRRAGGLAWGEAGAGAGGRRGCFCIRGGRRWRAEGHPCGAGGRLANVAIVPRSS